MRHHVSFAALCLFASFAAQGCATGGRPAPNEPGAFASGPVIRIIGANPAIVAAGDRYRDAGATAADAESGDITWSIVTAGFVDASVTGVYRITYAVTNVAGERATATRIVIVRRKKPR